jgi:glycosyltransferase involved in cell wall biosynthesis
MNEKNYSIIIPFYNEENNLIELHYELLEQLKKISSDKRKFQLIYVDDGSNDNTLLNIKSLDFNNFEYMIIENIINLSQSISLKNAIKESAYENIIILDGDLQNDPKDIPQMINIYENEKKSIDVVCGWRKFRKDNFFTRILPSLVANFLIRLLFKSKIHDHGCALKIIKKNVFNESNMWGDFHRLFLARIAHYKLNITEVQVNHRVRKDGKSNYGCGRIANVLIDLFYLKFVNLNKKNSIYFFGKISILLFY